MKLRNVKKSFSKKIVKGWRNYLTLNIKYKDIGVENNFLNIKVLADMLELEIGTDQVGIEGMYKLINPSIVIDGVKQSVIIDLCKDYIHNIDFTLEYFGLPEDTIFITNDRYMYYMEITQGFLNPKCIFDEETMSYPKEEPYWLHEGNESLEKDSFIVTDNYIDDNNITRDIVVEILHKYCNNNEFNSNIFSGEIIYRLISGNTGENITNSLFKDLSKLSMYCKTVYTNFEKDYVKLTYAIRYDDYIYPFLKDLKKLIKIHKVKL